MVEKITGVRNNFLTFLFEINLLPVLKSDHLGFREDELPKLNLFVLESLFYAGPFFRVARPLLVLIEGVLVDHGVAKLLVVSILGFHFAVTVLLGM